jgi:sulfate adenylyltransferase
VLFTGLSGSGKSTIARELHAALSHITDRAVTLLDGDVVRSVLSSELGFSRPHRDLNVRRIGYVAAEITRHGGIAICAPIAPYVATRAAVRAMVDNTGASCWFMSPRHWTSAKSATARGLYAKARAGQLPEFTGVSDPYETPEQADLTIDTAQTTVEATAQHVLAAAAAHGWLAT